MIVCNRVRESRLPPGQFSKQKTPGSKECRGFLLVAAPRVVRHRMRKVLLSRTYSGFRRFATVRLAPMLDLKLGVTAKAPPFLFVGANCDDIEIGCGGTALRLAREHVGAKVH